MCIRRAWVAWGGGRVLMVQLWRKRGGNRRATHGGCLQPVSPTAGVWAAGWLLGLLIARPSASNVLVLIIGEVLAAAAEKRVGGSSGEAVSWWSGSGGLQAWHSSSFNRGNLIRPAARLASGLSALADTGPAPHLPTAAPKPSAHNQTQPTAPKANSASNCSTLDSKSKPSQASPRQAQHSPALTE